MNVLARIRQRLTPQIADPDLRFVVDSWERLRGGTKAFIVQGVATGLANEAEQREAGRDAEKPGTPLAASTELPARPIGFQMPATAGRTEHESNNAATNAALPIPQEAGNTLDGEV